jgi:hypothetical protein
MVSSSIRQAQSGISLEDVYVRQAPAGRPQPQARKRQVKKKGGGAGRTSAAPSAQAALAPDLRARPTPPKPTTKRARAEAKAAAELTGPFLAPGSLTRAERLRLIAGIETVLEGVFTHLPLKRARYGFDPIQRLRILRSQVDDLTDDGFHAELADIVTRLRDAHTRYVGPTQLAGRVAVLPFLVEMAGTAASPTYVVTHVAPGLPSEFKAGVILDFWNGVPIDRAVQRVSEREVGGRPDTLRAWATQSLTMRALRFGPPPDEVWVEIDYHAPGSTTLKHTRVDWRIVNPNDVMASRTGLFAKRPDGDRRQEQAVNPAAESVRRAKVLLFAPHVLEVDTAKARATTAKPEQQKAAVIPTALPETLKAMSIPAPGGPFGYLRIYAFDSDPDSFITELVRLIPQLPDRGLIIDLRANPGGYIVAAERALQLFTPNEIDPTRFSVLATEFTRAMATASASLRAELAPWKGSLDGAVRNGELYAQPIPITDPAEANDLGQHYGGPVVLVGDATTYSAGDLFSAGFVDNAIGPFICVGSATGAGGANVWTYTALRNRLAGTEAALPTLPDGIDLSFSFRRATRAGLSAGIPIEDVGIAGMSYAMTYNDLMQDRPDLIARCVEVLKQQPFTRMVATLDPVARSVTVKTQGLDQLDVKIDRKREPTRPVSDAQGAVIKYPASARSLELTGLAGDTIRQRRRLAV